MGFLEAVIATSQFGRGLIDAPDPILSTPCLPLPVELIDDEFRGFVNSMHAAMKQARGVGLAAPQVGVPYRFAVIDIGRGPVVIVNPKVTSLSGNKMRVREGCLSLNSVHEWVDRDFAVKVEALDEHGREIEYEPHGGLLCHALQHECDHLDGKLFIDRMHRIERRIFMERVSKVRSSNRHHFELERRALAKSRHGRKQTATGELVGRGA